MDYKNLTNHLPYHISTISTIHNLNDHIESSLTTSNNMYHAFLSSLSITIVSEIGDKTFFIAAIMAMRHSRLIVFGGAMTALFIMTVLAACMGMLVTNIPRSIVVYMSALLFFAFGIKMLKEGYYMSPNEGQEEYQELQNDILKKEHEYTELAIHTGAGTADTSLNGVCISSPSTVAILDLEEGRSASSHVIAKTDHHKKGGHRYKAPTHDAVRHLIHKYFVPKNSALAQLICTVGLQAFTMTFLAEWGDRSQIATIVLAAKENVQGVTIGAILGHSLCTMLAVVAGRYISTKLSVRFVTLVGAIVFILFGLSTLLFDGRLHKTMEGVVPSSQIRITTHIPINMIHQP